MKFFSAPDFVSHPWMLVSLWHWRWRYGNSPFFINNGGLIQHCINMAISSSDCFFLSLLSYQVCNTTHSRTKSLEMFSSPPTLNNKLRPFSHSRSGLGTAVTQMQTLNEVASSFYSCLTAVLYAESLVEGWFWHKILTEMRISSQTKLSNNQSPLLTLYVGCVW